MSASRVVRVHEPRRRIVRMLVVDDLSMVNAAV